MLDIKELIPLKVASKDGLFVFQGGGWRIDQTLIDLIELFDEYGFY